MNEKVYLQPRASNFSRIRLNMMDVMGVTDMDVIVGMMHETAQQVL